MFMMGYNHLTDIKEFSFDFLSGHTRHMLKLWHVYGAIERVCIYSM